MGYEGYRVPTHGVYGGVRGAYGAYGERGYGVSPLPTILITHPGLRGVIYGVIRCTLIVIHVLTHHGDDP